MSDDYESREEVLERFFRDTRRAVEQCLSSEKQPLTRGPGPYGTLEHIRSLYREIENDDA